MNSAGRSEFNSIQLHSVSGKSFSASVYALHELRNKFCSSTIPFIILPERMRKDNSCEVALFGGKGVLLHLRGEYSDGIKNSVEIGYNEAPIVGYYPCSIYTLLVVNITHPITLYHQLTAVAGGKGLHVLLLANLSSIASTPTINYPPSCQ